MVKKLYIVLLFYGFANVYSQSPIDVKKDPLKSESLSEADFQLAKKMYLDMMQTAAYIKCHESMTNSVVKMNRVYIPNFGKNLKTDEQAKKWLEDPVDLKKFLEENIHKTKYSSVDEALKDLLQEFRLMKQYRDENRELFLLISKASLDQIEEIVKPEKDYLDNLTAMRKAKDKLKN